MFWKTEEIFRASRFRRFFSKKEWDRCRHRSCTISPTTEQPLLHYERGQCVCQFNRFSWRCNVTKMPCLPETEDENSKRFSLHSRSPRKMSQLLRASQEAASLSTPTCDCTTHEAWENSQFFASHCKFSFSLSSPDDSAALSPVWVQIIVHIPNGSKHPGTTNRHARDSHVAIMVSSGMNFYD